LITFSVSVGVYNNPGTIVESLRGPYTVALSLTSTGTVSGTSILGTVSINTASGLVTFSSLRILSLGSFTVTATSANIVTGTYSGISTVNYAFSMTLVSSIATPTRFFDFTVTASIKGEDTFAFIGSCAAYLTENGGTSILGTTSLTTTTGTAAFSIYFTVLGSKTITCTCPAVGSSPGTSATVSVTVLIPYLKVSLFSPIVKKI
jgi:hypothetical protein